MYYFDFSIVLCILVICIVGRVICIAGSFFLNDKRKVVQFIEKALYEFV